MLKCSADEIRKYQRDQKQLAREAAEKIDELKEFAEYKGFKE